MTTFEDAHARTISTGKARRISSMAVAFFGRMVAAVRHRAQIVAAERRLREMPDHMLKDIGLHRSEIHAAVRMGRDAFGR